MGIGDIGISAVVSLKSIDGWIATLNSNMTGSAKAGFRATRVKFAGNTVDIQRAPTGSMQGIQIGEQSLTTAQTSLDFTQGSVVASTEATHLAIQQSNSLNIPFFVLRQGDTAAVPTLSGPELYTRDGEFHFDANGNLRNQDGLFVIDSGGAVVDRTNNVDPVTGEIQLNELLIRYSTAPQVQLQFSTFGSTIFVGAGVPPVNLALTADANANGDLDDTAGAGGTIIGRVVPNALESSNASLAQTVPELSLAQKMYSAIAKVIQVSQTNLDTVLGLIR